MVFYITYNRGKANIHITAKTSLFSCWLKGNANKEVICAISGRLLESLFAIFARRLASAVSRLAKGKWYILIFNHMFDLSLHG